MRRYLSLCIAALAVVGVLTGGVQAANGAQPDSVKFIWNINIPGVLTIPLDNYTMQEGDIFRWQEVSLENIPPEYQLLGGVYWEAMGNSSITVNENVIHQNITIVISVQPGGIELFGYSIALSLQFDVYDGIVGGNSVEGLTLLNPSGTHFDFGRSDGLVLYFDLTPQFEEVYLIPLGLTREGLTLAFAEESGFTWEGITVSATYGDDGLIDGLTGEVAHLSTVVIVEQGAVTAVEPSSWAAIKALYR